MQDTSRAAARFYYERLRTLTPRERLHIAAELSMAVRQLAEAGLRQRHPDASAREVQLRLAVRLYGRACVARVFDTPPPDAG